MQSYGRYCDVLNYNQDFEKELYQAAPGEPSEQVEDIYGLDDSF